jgi:predicted restriction endonuclease
MAEDQGRKCGACGRPALPGKTRCQTHTDIASEQARARRRNLLDAGLCPVCPKREPPKPIVPGMSACRPCLDKQKAQTTKNRPKYVKTQRVSANKWRADCLARGICPECNLRKVRKGKTSCEVCGRRMSRHACATHAAHRDAVLAHYGHKCATPGCVEVTKEFLHVDHIDGGGNAHLKEIGFGKIFRWLIKNNFPPGFQILCVDCNVEKRDRLAREKHLRDLRDPTLDPKVKARREREVLRNDIRRDQVFEHYGQACDCCGSTRALQIDHIEGRGNIHRKALRGANFYYWLIRNNLPEGYRTLCAKCNASLGFYGYCPHEVARQAAKLVPDPGHHPAPLPLPASRKRKHA